MAKRTPDSGSESSQSKQTVPVERSKSGAARYLTIFQTEWSKEWSFIKKGSSNHYFWCDICRVERCCGHQGRTDVERHISSDGHAKKTKDIRTNQQLKSFFPSAPSVNSMIALESKVRRAEVKMTATMVKHNVPLAFADHLSPLLKDIFPDSEIAKAYNSAKMKRTCILNGALRPFYLGSS